MTVSNAYPGTLAALPPQAAFSRRGTCHWCGGKRKRIADVGGLQQGPKTQLCLECPGLDGVGPPESGREYLAIVTVRVPVTARDPRQAEERAARIADGLRVTWPPGRWHGDYQIDSEARPAREWTY